MPLKELRTGLEPPCSAHTTKVRGKVEDHSGTTWKMALFLGVFDPSMAVANCKVQSLRTKKQVKNMDVWSTQMIEAGYFLLPSLNICLMSFGISHGCKLSSLHVMGVQWLWVITSVACHGKWGCNRRQYTIFKTLRQSKYYYSLGCWQNIGKVTE